jgi:hypothetical protein
LLAGWRFKAAEQVSDHEAEDVQIDTKCTPTTFIQKLKPGKLLH